MEVSKKLEMSLSWAGELIMLSHLKSAGRGAVRIARCRPPLMGAGRMVNTGCGSAW